MWVQRVWENDTHWLLRNLELLDIWLQLVRVWNWRWLINLTVNNTRPLFFMSLMRNWKLFHLHVVAFLVNHWILMWRHWLWISVRIVQSNCSESRTHTHSISTLNYTPWSLWHLLLLKVIACIHQLHLILCFGIVKELTWKVLSRCCSTRCLGPLNSWCIMFDAMVIFFHWAFWKRSLVVIAWRFWRHIILILGLVVMMW